MPARLAPDAALQKEATRLLNHLTGAVVRSLRRQESICIAVSGGLDSSVLAALLARYADVPVHLLTVGVAGSVDPQRARVLARHLSLPLTEIVLTKDRVRAALPELVALVGKSPVEPERAQEWGIQPGTEFVSPLRTAWEAPIFFVARYGRSFAKRLVVGQGADEMFAGYDRYILLDERGLRDALERDRRVLTDEVLPLEARIAKHAGIEFHYPYLNDRVVALAKALPQDHLIHEGARKRVLREVARAIELPLAVIEAAKTAAQYGSGVGPLLKEIAEDAGLHQNEYLTRLLDQRRIGEPQPLRT